MQSYKFKVIRITTHECEVSVIADNYDEARYKADVLAMNMDTETMILANEDDIIEDITENNKGQE